MAYEIHFMKNIFLCAVFVFTVFLTSIVNAEDYNQLDSFVRLTINGSNVNLRLFPTTADIDGMKPVAQANTTDTSDVFIAEAWPIKDKRDNSMWYRILYSVDPKSSEVISLNRWNKEIQKNTCVFVNVRFTEQSYLSENEYEQVRQSAYLKYPMTLDSTEKAQREMVESELYLWGVNATEGAAIYENPGESVIGEFRDYWGDDWEPITGVVGIPSSPDWVRIPGSCFGKWGHPGGWIKVSEVKYNEKRACAFLKYDNFYFGENIPQILERWGSGNVTREYDDGYDQASGPYIRTVIIAPGLEIELREGYMFEAKWLFSYKITRVGAGVCGIFIGREWCGKEWVEKVLGKPEEVVPQDSGERWRFHFYSCNLDVTFSKDGLVAEIRLESWGTD